MVEQKLNKGEALAKFIVEMQNVAGLMFILASVVVNLASQL